MPVVILERITVVIILPTRQNAEIRGNQMNEAAISRAAESHYDYLLDKQEREDRAKEKATEMIEEAFKNQTPVPFVQFTYSNPKLQYEEFSDAVMGLIDYDDVKAALMVLLKSNSPEVKQFLAVCTKRHVDYWADEIGGVL